MSPPRPKNENLNVQEFREVKIVVLFRSSLAYYAKFDDRHMSETFARNTPHATILFDIGQP